MLDVKHNLVGETDRGGKSRSAKRDAAMKRNKGSASLGVLAWFIGLMFVLPLFWLVLTAMHSNADASLNPPKLFAPLTFEWFTGFFGGTTGASAMPYLLNSLKASGVSTVLVIVLGLPAAYALTIKPIERASDALFFFLGTKMLPLVAGIAPIFIVANFLSLLDNIWFLTAIYTGMNLPIAIWMLRSFMADLPRELFEAAALDGANLPRTFIHVIGPMLVPGLAATGLICFIFSWNELLFASVLGGVHASTAPVYLLSFLTTQGSFLPQVSAASIMISLPVLIAGFAAQDRLVQGLTMGTVK